MDDVLRRNPVDITPDILPLGPLAGEHNDDDGRALDEAFEAADASPQTYYGVPTEREDLPRPTRTLVRSFTVPAGGAPIMFFPADLKRKSVVIRCNSVGFVWGSDANEVSAFVRLNTGVSAAFFTNATVPMIIDGHTGPVWVAADLDSIVTVLVVTE